MGSAGAAAACAVVAPVLLVLLSQFPLELLLLRGAKRKNAQRVGRRTVGVFVERQAVVADCRSSGFRPVVFTRSACLAAGIGFVAPGVAGLGLVQPAVFGAEVKQLVVRT